MGSHYPVKVGNEKISILEIAKQPQVYDDTHGKQDFAFALDLLGKELLRDMPVYDRRYPQQNYKWWIPGRVKQVTGDQQVGFFCCPRQWCVVQRQHENEKRYKRK